MSPVIVNSKDGSDTYHFWAHSNNDNTDDSFQITYSAKT